MILIKSQGKTLLSLEKAHENYNEPIIHLANNIINQAIQLNASDIHIEPYQSFCRIRYRQDGILHEITEISPQTASQLISRLKVIANLDIAEKRIPQDGRCQFQQHDIRISTCPLLFGEKIVLRILNSTKKTYHIDQLGFIENQKKLFLDAILQPQGLILVTGPTGSGKTITLYSAIDIIHHQEKNISTIEDPVEIHLNGINQTQVNAKIDLSFSILLRSLLRQDPDVIMVGEIRDKETAELALQASHTGHLVLSTLHTNNAMETITRLKSMDIPPYQLAYTISLIISQRLIRILCRECKIAEEINSDDLRFLGYQAIQKTLLIYQPKGCQACHLGYKGRTAIYECLPITEDVRQIILSSNYSNEIAQYYLSHPYITLKQASMNKLLSGVTSLSEIKRVLTT